MKQWKKVLIPEILTIQAENKWKRSKIYTKFQSENLKWSLGRPKYRRILNRI
jgi:hypothetical protein